MESSSSQPSGRNESSNVADGSSAHVSTRREVADPSDQSRSIARFDELRTLLVDERAVRFTPLEYQLVQLLLDHLGRLVTYDELTQAAFATPDSVVSRAALEKHLDRIRSKVRTIGLDLPGVTNYGCLLIWSTVRRSSR